MRTRAAAQKHVLSWSHDGKTRLMSIPPERLQELRSKSQEYLRFRGQGTGIGNLQTDAERDRPH